MNIDYGFDENIITLRKVKSTGKLQYFDELSIVEEANSRNNILFLARF